MRELKFRAWDKKTQAYYEQIENDGDVYTKRELIVALIGTYSDFEDEDFVIEQYTNLKDKHGNEIYEGDILAPTKDHTNIDIKILVEWKTRQKNETYGHGDHGRSELSGFYNDGYYGLWSKMEIIGNKWENPELLKDV